MKTAKSRRDEISYVKENKQEIGIEIHSGRNRIVRRIFEFLGYTVTKLDRVYYAGLTKKNLKRGAWRFLSREEVERPQVRPVRIMKRVIPYESPFSINAYLGTSSSACSLRCICPMVR